ncbi:MAG: hypothetical protein Q7T76_03295 [Ferruginibacter sp.]|nr:hypothetical protein [Ferruginibacter sp.]
MNEQTLMSKEFFHPFMDIFRHGLTFTYRDIEAADGSCVHITIRGEAGGSWQITRSKAGWQLSKDQTADPHTNITIEPDLTWKLFSKSIVRTRLEIRL